MDVISIVRSSDPAQVEAVKMAYRRVFAGADGQIVLLAMLRDTLAVRGPALTPDERTYHQAMTDTVLKLAAMAGYDALSLAGAMTSGTLEGKKHGGSSIGVGQRRPILDDGSDF